MTYKHTQFGWVTVVACGLLLAFFAALPTPVRGHREILLLIPVSLLAAVVFLMGTLTVEVNDASVRLRFGIGLIRKTFSLEDIASCAPVKNCWWWGWGIRLFPVAGPGRLRGWLYNVSGLDAVELTMKNGKVFRIGTDEPQKLAECIQAKLRKVI